MPRRKPEPEDARLVVCCGTGLVDIPHTAAVQGLQAHLDGWGVRDRCVLYLQPPGRPGGYYLWNCLDLTLQLGRDYESARQTLERLCAPGRQAPPQPGLETDPG